MVACLTSGTFASSSVKQSEYIHTIIQICDELEVNLALGLLDLLKTAMEEIDSFDRSQNRHTDPQSQSVSIRLIDAYWMKVLQCFLSSSIKIWLEIQHRLGNV